MTDAETYQTQLAQLIQDKPFLFEHGNEFCPPDEYFPAMEKRAGKHFTRLALPFAYKPEILDEFKDRIVWSAGMMSMDGARSFLVLIQPSETIHVLSNSMFHQTPKGIAFTIDCWGTDPAELRKFIVDMEKFRITPQHTNMGFS